MENVGGIATILGRTYEFEKDGGYGLIDFDGQKALVKFECPMESLPPQGGGHIVGSTDITLTLTNGQLMYKDEPVCMGELVK